MKTIAITSDEPTLTQVDHWLARHRALGVNRSALLREALHAYLQRLEEREAEEAERCVWHRHRERLKRQTAAMLEEQATPIRAVKNKLCSDISTDPAGQV